VEEHLDTDKFAWAGAVSMLLGSSHAWARGNLRLYYDPARGKLEPIPYDYNSHRIERGKLPVGESDALALFRFASFRRMVGTRLSSLLENRVEPMLARADSLYAFLEAPLLADHHRPFGSLAARTHGLYVDNLRHNATVLKAALDSTVVRATTAVRRDGHWVAKLENPGSAFLEITSVRLQGPGGATVRAFDPPLVLDGRWFDRRGEATVDLGSPDGAESATWQVEVEGRNGCTGAALTSTGRSHVVAEEPVDWVEWIPSGPSPPDLPALPRGFRVDGDRVHVGPGTVTVREVIEIPSTYHVSLEPGLDLAFGEKAAIIAYGDLSAIGTESRPILVHGIGDTTWGALAVQGTRVRPSRVELRHVHVEGGTGTENGRSYFTGPFAVTDGNVIVDHCRFENGRAIDGVNLKYCEIRFTNSLIRGSIDDAGDFDFCRGLVQGNVVSHGGGDGIDFSGSDVEVVGNRVFACVDKGFSIGEGSRARVHHNVVTDCRIGIASKDGSEVVAGDLRFARLRVGIASYRKKLTFEAPRISVARTVLVDVESAVMDGGAAAVNLSDCVRFVRGPEEVRDWPGLRIERTEAPVQTFDEVLTMFGAAADAGVSARGFPEQAEHVSLVRLDAGLVEGIDLQKRPAERNAELEEHEELAERVGR
jgi:hypothetical protein